MNANLLTKLVAALTPDSKLRKALTAPPIYGPRPAVKRKTRAGYTKNHSQPRNQARVRMARESRRRNRA